MDAQPQTIDTQPLIIDVQPQITTPPKKYNTTGIKRKHQVITIQDKVELLKKLDSGVPVRHLCDIYCIGSTTVYDIIKRRDKILTYYERCDSKHEMTIRKSMKVGKSAEHDRAMVAWTRHQQNNGVELSGSVLMEQAKIIHKELNLQHDCIYSNGWLQRFKKRHGISFRKIDEDKDGADDVDDALAKIIAEERLVNSTTDSNSEVISVVLHPDVVLQGERDGEGCDDDRFGVDRLIELSSELIKGLEERDLVTAQELMSLYLLREKLFDEKTKCMKQNRLDEMFKKMAKKSVSEQ